MLDLTVPKDEFEFSTIFSYLASIQPCINWRSYWEVKRIRGLSAIREEFREFGFREVCVRCVWCPC